MELEELYALMERFARSGLTDLEWEREGEKIALRCAPAPVVVSAPAAAPAAQAAPAQAEAAAPAAQEQGETVNAPLVGTFYAAPTPDQPPFVQVGDRVKKGQPLCLLEAMKMMSEVTAPCDCEITAILKENGALVSFGDGLFGYKPC